MTEEYMHKSCSDIVGLKAEVQNMKEKIESLNAIEQAITKLTTIMEYQTRDNERRDEIINKQSENLTMLTTTIEKINTKIDKNDMHLEELDKKLDGQIERADKDRDKASISFNDLLRYAFFGGLGVLLTYSFEKFLK